MPRKARLIAEGYPHHITQRGNYKQIVFFSSQDYSTYLHLLEKYRKKYKLNILAYCLMPNHVHLIAVPENKDSMAKTFSNTHMRYAHYLHEQHNRTGHLWQGRFFSCILSDTHLYSAIRYVENNPVKAHLAKTPYDWPWSSTKEHIKNKKTQILTLTNTHNYLTIDNWEKYLSEKEDEKIIQEIKKSTLKGRPAGNISFLTKIEQLLGIRLIPLKPWPRKKLGKTN